MTVCLKNFEYDLPERLIAQQPAAKRESSRLMRLFRDSGRVSHHRFEDIPSLLREGDLLVLNDTRVIPARFFCRRASGGRVEGLFLKVAEPGRWEVLLKNAGRCKPGEWLTFDSADQQLELLENCGQGRWIVSPQPAGEPAEILDKFGITPLPPYIRRGGQNEKAAGEDHNRYQTVYADRPGAVAAPTAGLHFTEAIFDALAGAGISTTRVTLHVGLGTFLPVKHDDLAAHPMHSEWYDMPAAAAEAILAAKAQGRRVVAVGTTAMRVCESVARVCGGQVAPASGWTELFLYPPAEFSVIDAMLTNFHLPASTLLMLVAAFCQPGGTDGIQTILDAYAEAIRHEYRFFSYGDAMLIETTGTG
ncbi:MAG: tRNA preQ1(34) S-adenosylmethionine ribosyltransferase-isomerase QueA [Phycisphaerae bacterium]|nr:tRNA preQ1(34) S-adenosylmethionine ribosyltransferase-isomerase QueA [Phycisphaerae bacterium]